MSLKDFAAKPLHLIAEKPQSIKANGLPKLLASDLSFQFSSKPHFKCMHKKGIIN